jgi:probable HAF family extracellular repeat protein
MRRTLLFALAFAAWFPLSGLAADGPAKKLQVVSPKDVGIIATGINGRGEVIGFEWVEDQPGILSQKPFFARGKEMTYLPLLEGYTATFPAAVSDEGLVVGRAGKPSPPGVFVHLRNQAFVWDAKGGMRGLGVPEGDTASFASGITRDGRRISGFAVGPDRTRACVWDRDGDSWTVTVLPHGTRLGSNVVPISDDGRYVAAVDGVSPCLWTRGASGSWTREVLGEPGSLVPRAVNNSGTVVGLRYANDGPTHAVIWSRDGGTKQIEKPEGYVRSEAGAVNNLGAVVGMVDGPNGSELGPRAFVYENGRLRLIDEGGPGFTVATAINDAGQVAGVLEDEEDE